MKHRPSLWLTIAVSLSVIILCAPNSQAGTSDTKHWYCLYYNCRESLDVCLRTAGCADQVLCLNYAADKTSCSASKPAVNLFRCEHQFRCTE